MNSDIQYYHSNHRENNKEHYYLDYMLRLIRLCEEHQVRIFHLEMHHQTNPTKFWFKFVLNCQLNFDLVLNLKFNLVLNLMFNLVLNLNCHFNYYLNYLEFNLNFLEFNHSRVRLCNLYILNNCNDIQYYHNSHKENNKEQHYLDYMLQLNH